MMDKSDHKVGKIFLVFAGICIVALPLIVWAALSTEPPEMAAGTLTNPDPGFDQQGEAVFQTHNRIARAYMEGISTERTLAEYYSRRQYLGSPPFIPHEIEMAEQADLECKTCHVKGGWTEEMKRHTPLTPHPEHTACKQCHVRMTESDKLFMANYWLSVSPPRLGRAYLPGAPPPVPHTLQMRGDCIACHVGPAAVTEIRVEHPSRGNCRQCHVPDDNMTLFERKAES